MFIVADLVSLRVESYICVFSEVLWRKVIQLLSNKTIPHFKLLPMSKVDQSLLPIH